MTKLETGQKIPEFTLFDQNETEVSPADFLGKKTLLYFYPKAETPGCTKQSCHLRDLINDNKINDVQIIGISPDGVAAQKKFDEKHSLGFPLLADTENEVAKKFGVWREKLNFGNKHMGIVRSAFLVDETGTLVNTWYKISPDDTPKKLLEALA